ncbi:MAG: copper homeostasis protein CutC [Bacteroidales bacterium]
MARPVFEVCVDSIDSAIAAEQGGAQRVELCSDLLEGGLTPSYGVLKTARERLTIGIMAMVRPRGGDFCYSEAEFAAMRHDVRAAKEIGARGVVFGVLNPDGTVDEPRTRELVREARPLAVTFHRAFDMTRDPFAALETLIGLGVDRILTSGQEPTVLEGLDLLAEIVERAAGRVIVMPGGGITDRNIARIRARVDFSEMHFAGGEPVESRMRFRNPRVFMGGLLRPPEYALDLLQPSYVQQVIAAAR